MINLENININEKAEYVTFTSPIKKNRKGHKHQINKSFKKINNKEREVIFKDLDMILKNFEEISKDYLTFLNAKNQYHEQAIKWVFEGSQFLKKDNEKKLLNLIETRIPVKVADIKEIKNEEDEAYYEFIYPTTILVGPSGSGKTTFLKQIIGAMNTSFPATSQANTTVGPLYVVNDVNSNSYTATVKFIGEESLLERIKSGYIESLKVFLSIENEEDLSSDEKVIDIIYKKFTIFDDKKVKLQNLLLKKDISNDLLKCFKKECFEFWEFLKKIANKQGIVIDNKFSNNRSDEFWEVFNDSIDEKLLNIESDSTINKFIEILNERIREILNGIFEFLREKEVQWEFKILDYKKEYTINSTTKLSSNKNFTFELPKMITFEMEYNSNYEEVALQELFFKTMEFISSAHEEMQGKTLFPLVNQIRIKGCFKPLWETKEHLSNYILIDSEGIGHDLANTTISNELRKMMLAANNITLIQNGAEQMSKAFSLTLRTLIHNALISKTKFCFNRLEAFDSTAQNSVQSKKSFIEGNIKNALKDIVQEEANSKIKIVTDREYIYEDIILGREENNSYYMEFLDKNITDRTGFITTEGKAIKELFEKMNKDIPSELSEVGRVKFNEEFNPIDQLRNYLKSITIKIDNSEKFAKALNSEKLSPIYQLDILSGILNNANNIFVNDFIEVLNTSKWQTVKAFNYRIANDVDGREWRLLKPESMLTDVLIKHILSYLLNPMNIKEIINIFGNEEGDFVKYINNAVSSQITEKIMMLVRKKIYLELLESCWKKGYDEMKGKGSTSKRKSLIKDTIEEKFKVNNELYKFNELYIDVKEIITETPQLKNVKANYR